jgi:hypothetical protein
VVAISLVPFIRQHSEASGLRPESATLEKATVSEIPSRTSPRTSARDTAAGPVAPERLENKRQPVEAGPLLDDLMKVMMEQDIAGIIRVLTPVARMTPPEYAQPDGGHRSPPASPEAKSKALMILASFAPETDFRERLESLIRQGAAPEMLGEPLRLWAANDPDAALAWFESARTNGQLLGTGVHSDPAPGMFADILVAIAKTQPDRALELAASMPAGERGKFRIDEKLAAAFAQASSQSDDTRQLERPIAETTDPAPGPASKENLDRIAESITARVTELGDITSSPVAFLRLLPALLPLVEPLDIDELIAVADRLGSGGLFPPTDEKSSARLVLYLLAAEQDPLKVLSREDLDLASDEGYLQTSIFNILARKDPDAAIRWLDSQSMDDGPKSGFQRGIALGLLAHDPRRGLDFILEHPAVIPSGGMGLIIAGLRIPDAARDQLIEALPDPRYAALRPTLSKMVLESSLATARVAELRDQTSRPPAWRHTGRHLSPESFRPAHPARSGCRRQMDEGRASRRPIPLAPLHRHPPLDRARLQRRRHLLGTMERGPARDQSIKEFADVVANHGAANPPPNGRLKSKTPPSAKPPFAGRQELVPSTPRPPAAGWKSRASPHPMPHNPETESP